MYQYLSAHLPGGNFPRSNHRGPVEARGKSLRCDRGRSFLPSKDRGPIEAMSFHFEIPDDVVESLHLPREEAERELRTDLALVLYARGALSSGKAAEMAGVSRWAFEDLLAQRKIERPFTEADWEHRSEEHTSEL